MRAAVWALLVGTSVSGNVAEATRLGPDSPLALQIAGAAFETTEGNVTTVPESATAASLNITVVNPEREGYLTVWPCGVARPLASNLNFTAGAVVPNGVLASLGADGSVCLFSSAPTDVLVDVSGWFDGEAFEGSTPTRLVDTREGRGAPQAPTTPSTPVSVPVASLPVSGALGTAKTIPAAVSAVALNVTVVNPSAAGFVTVWPCGEDRPNASNLNFEAGQVVANGVIAPVGGNGSVCAFSSVPTDLIVDLAGWFPGDLFSGTTPTRLLDSRDGGASKLGAGGISEVAILGRTLSGGSAVPSSARAVSLNVTVTGADAPGYLTVWPCGLARPNASNVNFVAGQTVANNVLAPMDGSGKICVFSSAPTHVIVDVAGWVNAETQAAAFAGAISRRLADTRLGLWNDIGARPEIDLEAFDTCPIIDLHFRSQSEVDAFDTYASTVSECKNVLGSVIIEGTDITGLSGLRRLKNVDGRLIIRNTSLKNFRDFHPSSGFGIEFLSGLVIEGNNFLKSCTTFSPLFNASNPLKTASVTVENNSFGCDSTHMMRGPSDASFGIQFGEPRQFDFSLSIDPSLPRRAGIDWMYPVVIGRDDSSNATEVVSLSMSEGLSLDSEIPVPVAFLGFSNEQGAPEDRTFELNPELIPGVIIREQIIEDFSGDGLEDIFLNIQGTEAYTPFPGAQNILMLQTGQGSFTRAPGACLPQRNDFSHGSSAGDIDGDGDMDLFINNLGSVEPWGSYIMLNDGAGCFTEVYDRQAPNEWFDEKAVTTGCSPYSLLLDMDGDQDLDIFFPNNPEASCVIGKPGFFENLGGRFTFTEAPEFSIVDYSNSWNYETIDFNQDGLDDILIPGVSPSGELESPFNIMFHLFQNTGEGGFIEVTDTVLHPEFWAHLRSVGVVDTQIVDLNSDGFDDIAATFSVYFNHPKVPFRSIQLIFFSTGDGSFHPPTFDLGTYDLEQKCCFDEVSGFVFLDLNGDGIKDLVYKNLSGGVVRLGYVP